MEACTWEEINIVDSGTTETREGRHMYEGKGVGYRR